MFPSKANMPPASCRAIASAVVCVLLAQQACTGLQDEKCASIVLSTTSSSHKQSYYSKCSSLPKLGASLHWTHHPSNGTVDVAYRAPQSASGWVGWGLNPAAPGGGMVGAEVLLAFFPGVGPGGAIAVYTASLDSYTPTIRNETLPSFPAGSRSAEYAGGFMTVYATLRLPKNGSATKVDQVWQAGSLANLLPATHPQAGDNLLSKGSIDFLSGDSTVASGGSRRLRRKNVHGVLNAVGWGVLMPTGAIIARYLKVFKSADPAWFYLHVACQLSAYAVGAAGWGTGLKLGGESVGISYSAHRNIGIALFCLATLQVLALLLRPNKDNKYRVYWNVYHHSVGYTVIVLSVVNVFKGLDILDPDTKWKNTYTAIIIALGAVALVLEAVTWLILLKRRRRRSSSSSSSSSSSPQKSHHGTTGHGQGV